MQHEGKKMKEGFCFKYEVLARHVGAGGSSLSTQAHWFGLRSTRYQAEPSLAVTWGGREGGREGDRIKSLPWRFKTSLCS